MDMTLWTDSIDFQAPHVRVRGRHPFLNYLLHEVSKERVYSECLDSRTFDAYTTESNLAWRVNNFLHRYGYESEISFADSMRQEATIADLGAGAGIYLQWLSRLFPNARIIGADFSDSLLHLDRSVGPIPSLCLLRCDLNREIPIRSESLDYAICDYVLSEVRDPLYTLSQIARILRSGGRLVASFSLRQPLLRRITDQYFQNVYLADEPTVIDSIASELTQLAKELAHHSDLIRIEKNYPQLGIAAGEYPVQRFIYHFFLNCFWNGDEVFSRKRNRSNFLIAGTSKRFESDDVFQMIGELFHIESVYRDCSAMSMRMRKV
jgi:ubiquinone/menaquinone biosynthesis C-methylase UbiE